MTIRAEIEQRVEEIEAGIAELPRLKAALAALEGADNGAGRPRRSRARRRAAAKPRSRRRAPRGANRDALLRVIGQRPGVSVGEASAASGVAKPTAYNVVRGLVREGLLTKTDDGGLERVPQAAA